jgi:hypothetical protein
MLSQVLGRKIVSEVVVYGSRVGANLLSSGKVVLRITSTVEGKLLGATAVMIGGVWGLIEGGIGSRKDHGESDGIVGGDSLGITYNRKSIATEKAQQKVKVSEVNCLDIKHIRERHLVDQLPKHFEKDKILVKIPLPKLLRWAEQLIHGEYCNDPCSPGQNLVFGGVFSFEGIKECIEMWITAKGEVKTFYPARTKQRCEVCRSFYAKK